MSNNNYNKQKYYKQAAVALGYDPNHDPAPRVLASGADYIADKILEIAQQHDIPIHQDPNLAKTLMLLEINSLIPLEAYQIVAKILSWLYKFEKNADQSQNMNRQDKDTQVIKKRRKGPYSSLITTSQN